MASLGIHFRQLDRQAINFEAMVTRVGSNDARTAFARALNHEGRKGNTAVKRQIRQATSIKLKDVQKAIRFHTAGKQTLKTVNRAYGGAIPLRYFGARQFKYGVSATVWGKKQKFPGAFIVKSIAGNVFKNTGGFNAKAKRNNQIEKMFGPHIPKEMLKPDVIAAFNSFGDHVGARALHELKRILTV